MRGLLVLLAVMASFIIVVALVHQKPVEPQPIMVIATTSPIEQSDPPAALVTPLPETPPMTIKMPEPVLITSWKDIGVIADPGLRTFVRRKANFKSDKVLYFEWRGGVADKLTGDLTTKDKLYTITLHPSSGAGEVIVHRQVFVIPSMYAYVVEMAKPPLE